MADQTPAEANLLCDACALKKYSKQTHTNHAAFVTENTCSS